MSTKIFVNLPVKDLTGSIEFFTGLGFRYEPHFTDENGACIVIGADSYVMLLVEPFFRTFTGKERADTTGTAETIVALGVEGRQRVDELVDKALATGGAPFNDRTEEDGMYGRSFQDPDGHLWEVFSMPPPAVPPAAATAG
ncbi:VOC family protein [Kitasatospora sp. NPDC050543]|uniref:VOC family protein n=1 Tax=Kitasatospora sp. NPDC050543 TaxID=3364054 RepID=UPI00379CC999